MNVKKLTLAEAKVIALELYLKEISQKEIARMLRVTETTVSTWATQNNWKIRRAEVMATQESRLKLAARLYDYQTRAHIMRIEKYENQLLNGEIKELPLIEKGESDSLAKLFAMIKGNIIEWETLMNVNRIFMNFLSQRDPSLAAAVMPHSDEFIIIKRELFNI